MNRSVPIDIRFAEISDVPVILGFIRELADYERLSHEVAATESQLQHTLFGKRPAAEVLLASSVGNDVGFALFFHNYSTFLGKPGIYLEDLYVRPEARGQGIGGALLRYLARLAMERDCGRLEWSVLDWNTTAVEFYRSVGAEAMDEWTGYRVSGDALAALAGE